MNQFINSLNQSFELAVASSTNEVEFLRKFVDICHKNHGTEFKGSNNMLVKFRSKFVHQKPYAFFIDPHEIAAKTKTELGDILILVKQKHHGLTEKRATFVQVKWKNEETQNWKIEEHQYEFWKNIKTNVFTFGKKVMANSCYEGNRFNGLKNSEQLCQYLFIGKKCILTDGGIMQNINEIINVDHLKDLTWLLLNYKNKAFKQKVFELLNGDGEKVEDNLEEIISIIYKYLQWENDPPEEYEDYFSGENGFVVFEFTIESIVK